MVDEQSWGWLGAGRREGECRQARLELDLVLSFLSSAPSV